MIVVLGEGAADDPAPALAVGLRRLGEPVVLGAPDTGAPDTGAPRADGLITVPCAMASADEVAQALARAQEAAGPIHAVVLVSAGAVATVKGELTALEAAEWSERVEKPLRRTLACLQGSHRHLRVHGGSLLILLPTLSLVGSAGFAPWAAVAEAQRALAKSAARAWGPERVTVNCVAVSGELLTSNGAISPDRPGLPPLSLATRPDMETDVAAVVASLVTRAWAGVTGATVAVDGGVWMTP